MVTKKFLRSGEKTKPWGPLMSLSKMRVAVVFSRLAPAGAKRMVAMRSADSQTSLTQYSRDEDCKPYGKHGDGYAPTSPHGLLASKD